MARDVFVFLTPRQSSRDRIGALVDEVCSGEAEHKLRGLLCSIGCNAALSYAAAVGFEGCLTKVTLALREFLANERHVAFEAVGRLSIVKVHSSRSPRVFPVVCLHNSFARNRSFKMRL
jgi:hypothetical protein